MSWQSLKDTAALNCAVMSDMLKKNSCWKLI